MVKDLLRVVTRPLGFLGGQILAAAAGARLGPAGVLEVRLDQPVKHPLLLLHHLEDAVEHENVRAVLLHVTGMTWGWATLQEWRAGLERIRSRGCLVVVYAASATNSDMYLASAADRMVVAPMGEVALMGVGGRLRFIGPALEKLGLQFDVEAAGAYKSMGESFTRAFPTNENREAVTALIDDLHDELVREVAKGRKLTEDVVQALMDTAPLSPQEAVEVGLIDLAGYDDQVDELLEGLLGDEMRRVNYRGVEMLLRTSRRLDTLLSPDPLVAVLHLAGNINMAQGPSGRTRISPHDVVPVLKAMRESDRVEAVVLSVNSPGGSVLASDLIWREVQLLAEAKPTVASFSDIAASGGYYISAPVEDIVARPGTLTGSIGVVGGKLVVGKAASMLGVHSESIERGANIGLYSPEQPFTDGQRAKFRARLEQTYEGFVRRVSEGRKRPYDEMEAVARGRVWTGRQALESGLVDDLGGLEEALRRARQKAGIGPAMGWRRADVLVRPPRGWFLEMVPMAARIAVDSLGLGSLVSGVQGLAPMAGLVDFLSAHSGEPLALLPGEIDVR
ncbi:MAG: signal peptide peptidase SppA [Proteobacteria bacterium]|nr:signal peptide peptidase SppA [Pseudomonadota bacterium]MCP4915793.1 signal peptide peptidase SppA [Pseudomonadota bacterium]